MYSPLQQRHDATAVPTDVPPMLLLAKDKLVNLNNPRTGSSVPAFARRRANTPIPRHGPLACTNKRSKSSVIRRDTTRQPAYIATLYMRIRIRHHNHCVCCALECTYRPVHSWALTIQSARSSHATVRVCLWWPSAAPTPILNITHHTSRCPPLLNGNQNKNNKTTQRITHQMHRHMTRWKKKKRKHAAPC
jgi:hypothetical protein